MSKMIHQDNTPTTGATTASAVEVPSYIQKQSFGQLLRGDLGFVPVLLTLIVITIYFAATTGGLFLAPGNLSNLLQQIVNIGIDGLGVTLVLLLGEVDLSVAAVGTFGAVVMGVLSERMGWPPGLAILAAILAGAAAGFVNGFFVAVLRVPSFIVTLASSIFFSGLLINLLAGQATLIVHDNFIVSIAGSAYSFLPDWIGIGVPTVLLILYSGWLIINNVQRQRMGLKFKPLAQLVGQIALTAIIVEGVIFVLENTPGPVRGTFLGVPNSAAILFGLIVIIWLVLTKTRFGRHIYATGGNLEAARRAGIPVVAIRIAVFTLCSALAAVGGVLLASRQNSVQSQIPPTLLLDAIAAAVIGGVSLFGGRGSAWSIVLGALIIGSVDNGLDLKSQGTDIKEMVEGAVLVLAVTVDALARRAQARSGSGR